MADKKPISKREKILLGITLGVALVACIQYWYRPQLKKWSDAQTKIVQLQTQITANQQILASFSQTRNVASDDAGSDLRSLIEQNSSLPSFVDELTQRARDVAFSLARIELKTQVEADGLLKSDFSLLAAASFAQLGLYLEALERSAFVVQVNSVQITRHEDDLRQLDTKLEMSTYQPLTEALQ